MKEANGTFIWENLPTSKNLIYDIAINVELAQMSK